MNQLQLSDLAVAEMIMKESKRPSSVSYDKEFKKSRTSGINKSFLSNTIKSVGLHNQREVTLQCHSIQMKYKN